jgi:microsomal dipeptidase-like Zn-dependent dipeptidase
MFLKPGIVVLGLFILSGCDNVLNRAKAPVYVATQEAQKHFPDCSSLDLERGLFNKKHYRLVTEQKLRLPKNSTLVLEQVVPVFQDHLYLSFKNLKVQQPSFNEVNIKICLNENAQQVHEGKSFLIKEVLSEVDFAETLLQALKNKRLFIIVNNFSAQEQLLTLDLRYQQIEGQPLQASDKNTAQENVRGFADLHLHQTGAMAFNQGWYWGSHEIGSLAERLPDCQGEHASMFEFEHFLDGKITGPIAYSIAPRHDVDDFMRSHRHMTEAKDYVRSNDRKHQQVAYERLKEARERGLTLIISTVVENNVLLDIMYAAEKGRSDWYPSVMESIKRQLVSLKQMDEESEWFEIVYDPWHARRAINEGKLAVVLGAEFTDIFPPSDGPWNQQLYDLYALGLRHLQPVHKSDSQFSSTHDQGFPFDNLNLLRAFMRSEIPNKPALQRSFGQSDPAIGLAPAAYDLLDEMVHLHMIIDLSHASLSGQKEMTDYLLERHNFYPFIYSHWSARSPELLDKLKQAGGMIPFGWGQPVPELASEVAENEKLTCKDFVKERALLYKRYIDYGINFTLASDMNGFTSTTQPNFGPRYCELDEQTMDRSDQTKTWENMQAAYPEHPEWVNRYWAQGTADISLLPGIVYDLRDVLGMDTEALDSSAETFIKMWERTYDKQRKAVEF